MWSQVHLCGLVRNKAVDGAINTKKAALMIDFDHGESAFCPIHGFRHFAHGSANSVDFLVLELEGSVDHNAMELACAGFQHCLQICLEGCEISVVIRRVS